MIRKALIGVAFLLASGCATDVKRSAAELRSLWIQPRHARIRQLRADGLL